jgi:HPt (histidine-containing phosphotransfer) domain-containing protein
MDSFGEIDDLADARLALADRIEALARALGSLTVAQVTRDIHSIKGLAASYGLVVVSGLAHALESDMARYGADAPLLEYLDRMIDALDTHVRNDPVWLNQLIRKARRSMNSSGASSGTGSSAAA